MVCFCLRRNQNHYSIIGINYCIGWSQEMQNTAQDRQNEKKKLGRIWYAMLIDRSNESLAVSDIDHLIAFSL